MGLDKFDLAIIALYLLGITLFGLRFRKRHRSLRDYFLAGRDIPWWAISLSIVAAETSTLTIISIPGLAYDTNLTFLQVVMGYVVGRFVISFVLLPHYFRGEIYTAYELIERRFGRGLRSLTAGIFLLTRTAAEGVRVYAVSIVIAIALGTGEVASIAIICILTLRLRDFPCLSQHKCYVAVWPTQSVADEVNNDELVVSLLGDRLKINDKLLQDIGRHRMVQRSPQPERRLGEKQTKRTFDQIRAAAVPRLVRRPQVLIVPGGDRGQCPWYGRIKGTPACRLDLGWLDGSQRNIIRAGRKVLGDIPR